MPTTTEVKWQTTTEFKASWKKYLAINPQIKKAMSDFNDCKRASPPQRLPSKMSEHKLDGPLKGYMDCHLDDDIILIYKNLPGGIIKLLLVCRHEDLKGPRARTTRKKLGD
jgi:addiction module RelE/StbE family toxin